MTSEMQSSRCRMMVSLCLPLISCLLSGCVASMMESGHIAVDTATRDQHLQAALAGDPEAQYRVGNAYCCTPRHGVDAFYNNQKATEFLCMAAKQGHAPAAYELGRIHAGERVKGVRILRRIATRIRDDGVANLEIARYWYQQAAENGSAAAREQLSSFKGYEPAQFAAREVAPCTIAEVYGGQ